MHIIVVVLLLIVYNDKGVQYKGMTTCWIYSTVIITINNLK